MSKAKAKPDPDLADEYDFRGGVRGKYVERYAKGVKVVVTGGPAARPARKPSKGKRPRLPSKNQPEIVTPDELLRLREAINKIGGIERAKELLDILNRLR